ncbi:hypothetical protein [Paramicrobacterium chengjingii]|uniref:ABC-2 type transport system permease protein n=1 Tax=Paramicrobacterium chengjingii TaxID=2769067 RepID=A0ABX6YN00_9MICO|nr:hypothetical protein [Microbacterium chengjingii]QPZ39675.1 hypothetical protein HCR76_06410 [Microbacterium chengjingii]
MVAQLLRLRLQLAFGTVRGRPARIIGAVLLIIVVGVGTWLLAQGLVGLASAGAANVRDLLIVTGSFVVLGFLLIPAMLGVTDPLDPRTFAPFGIRSSALAPGTLLASLLSIPSLVVIVLSFATIGTWSRGAFATVIAVICAVFAIATCALVGRIAEYIASGALVTRKSRELRVVFLVLILVLIAPAIIFALGIDWSANSGMSDFGRAAEAVSWTPFGAVWAAPGEAALGDVAGAVGKLAIAAGTTAVLYFVWWALVARALRTAPREIPEGGFGSLGWFDIMPARASSSIAARSLSYWGRDARYIVSILIIPVLPFLLIPPLLIAGVPAQPLALVPLPFMCLFLGWSLHNDLAFDASAVWLHVASGVKGYADRLGRTAPTLLIGVPIVVIGSMISMAFFGDWSMLPSMFGVSACLLLASLGVASYLSTRFPYPAAAPGDSPFQQPQYSGARGGFSQTFGLLIPVVLSVPTLYFAWRGLLGDADATVWALLTGVGTGILVFIAGIWLGGRAFDRRGPEIIEFATSH